LLGFGLVRPDGFAYTHRDTRARLGELSGDRWPDAAATSVTSAAGPHDYKIHDVPNRIAAHRASNVPFCLLLILALS
jgi:hypothetical protein